MNNLKKGDLVMTEMGLAWYDRIENGEHLVNPVSWEKDHLSPHFSVYIATRPQVEAYLKEKGWEGNILGNWAKDDYHYWVKDDSDEYCVKEDGGLYADDFDTAPEQLREAITMARLLNATKD